jgi:hypothetical protein
LGLTPRPPSLDALRGRGGGDGPGPRRGLGLPPLVGREPVPRNLRPAGWPCDLAGAWLARRLHGRGKGPALPGPPARLGKAARFRILGRRRCGIPCHWRCRIRPLPFDLRQLEVRQVTRRGGCGRGGHSQHWVLWASVGTGQVECSSAPEDAHQREDRSRGWAAGTEPHTL